MKLITAYLRVAATEIPSLTLHTLSTAPLTVVYDAPPSPVREIITYCKEVQTIEDWTPPESEAQAKRLGSFTE